MSSIGKRLKEARLRSELDIEDVYLKIKISPNILIALEHDEAEAILEGLYVRKFLKQYADFLGLDGAGIEKEYAQAHNSLLKTEASQALKVVLPKPKASTINFSEKFAKKFFPAVIILLVFAISVVFLRNLAAQRRSKVVVPDTKGPAAMIPAKSELILIITAKEKVWIEVKSDGKILMKNFLSAGGKESWKAKDYFEITVGKPESVDIWLNEQKVVVPAHKKIRNARLDYRGIAL